MRDETKEVLLWIGLLAIGFIIGALSIGAIISEGFMDEAVEKGKAEYYINSDNEKDWRWKE